MYLVDTKTIIIMKEGVHLRRMALAFCLISVTASRQYIWLSASVSPTPTCMASLLLNLEKHRNIQTQKHIYSNNTKHRLYTAPQQVMHVITTT